MGPVSIGGYELGEELGAGGMGTVFRAHRGADVFAVKLVHAHMLDSADAVERFRREIRVGTSVCHRNVVRTIDGGCEDGRHYLVMEYVEGQTLHDLSEELGTVPEQLCLHVAREVAQGLAAIHAVGAIHRDIKPENVLITPDHVVKIMDLGVARLVDEALRLSRTGAFVGSLCYAAPECFRSDLGAPDHRVDLHALGLVLYELATGVAPYAADDLHGSILRVLEEIPRRMGDANPQVSPYFEELVHTLLVKDPRGRFASAEDLLAVLRGGEGGAWWAARRAALRRESRKPLRRIRVPRETGLYGREDELAVLRESYDRAASGDGRVLLLEGEAGIGKSRLVDEFVARLESEGADVQFAFGHYPPGGAATASTAFATAFREQLGDQGSAPFLPENPALAPAFDALLRGDPPPPGRQPLDKDALQACFVRTARNMAARSVLVVLIEDLHFAPEEGRALFASLAMGVAGHRVLLIGTSRPGMPEDWRAAILRPDHAAQLDVERMGPKDLVRMLAEALGSEHLAERLGGKIAVKSDGNPFFAFEILRDLRDGDHLRRSAGGAWETTRLIDEISIPPTVRDLVAARIAALGDEERDVLDVAACWGFEFDPRLVAAALGESPIPLFKRLARIERGHRLVRSSGRLFRFDHHQVQEVLYQTLPEVLREEYHAALAVAHEKDHDARHRDVATIDGPVCVDLCAHFLRGARPRDARRYFERAFRFLCDGHRNEEAVTLADLALEAPGLLVDEQRLETLLALAAPPSLLGLLGRRQRQEERARESLALARTLGAPRLEHASLRALASVMWRSSRHAEAETVSSEGLALARRIGDRGLEAASLGFVGLALQRQGRLADARDLYEQSLAIAREIGDRERQADSLFGLGSVTYRDRRLDEARAYLSEALAIRCELSDRRGEASTVGSLGAVEFSSGHLQEAIAFHERHREISVEVGNRVGEAAATGNLGIVYLAMGEPLAAKEHCEQHLALSRELGNRHGEAIAIGNLGAVHKALGAIEEALRCHREYGRLCREAGNVRGEAIALHNVAQALRDAGSLDEAVAACDACLALCAGSGDVHVTALTRLLLGSLHAEMGAPDVARRELSCALETSAERPIAAVEVLARCELACTDPGAIADALRAYDAHADRLEAPERVEADWLLWRATGDRARLRSARAAVEESLASLPDEVRERVLATSRVYSGVLDGAR